MHHRLSTGVPGFDELLGGGLLPGTLTVVVGASGIGKTQLGIQFAAAGAADLPPRRGCFLDLTARVDSQNHADYAQRLAGWRLSTADSARAARHDCVFDPADDPGDLLHPLSGLGRRVTARDEPFDRWQQWEALLAARLQGLIGFCYRSFVRGCRRVVIDGIEPAERFSESIQFELVEYFYHQVLRKEHDWLARDLFREHYRAHAQEAAAHPYDHKAVAALLLYTCHESLLDDLLQKPLTDADLLATANTLIYMGRTKEAGRIGRGLYVAKHRGSACSDRIHPYAISDAGLTITG